MWFDHWKPYVFHGRSLGILKRGAYEHVIGEDNLDTRDYNFIGAG
jgi:hypothetical protein